MRIHILEQLEQQYMRYWKVGLISILIFTAIFSSSLIAPPTSAYPPFYNQGQDWVDSIFQSLTAEERMAQLIMVATYSNRDANHKAQINKLITENKIGGLIFFQGGPVRQAMMTNHFQAKSKVPLLIAMDAEWGLGMRLDSTVSYPYQMALGAVTDNDLIYAMGTEVARQFKRLGVHVNFAPVVDVNNNPNNPVINYRAFGEDREQVMAKGLAYMKGMQDHGVMAVAKHFPGHGDTDIDSHESLPLIPHQRQRLDSVELYPFTRLIQNGVGGVMVAHMSIPSLDATTNLPSTLSRPIITDLLKKEMGFKGLVFTDALNMKGITKHFPPGEVDVKALIAGNDVLVFTQDVPLALKKIKEAVKAGVLTQQDIDRRCKKVLEAKYWAGLHKQTSIEIDGLIDDLNTVKANLLNRQISETSLTLLRNQNNLLPLQRLDTLRIAAVSIGAPDMTSFQKMLSVYTRVDHFNISQEANPQAASQLETELANYNFIITGLHQQSGRANSTQIYSPAVQELVNRLANYSNVVCVFRNPYTLEHFENLDQVPSLLVTYQDNHDTEELAAQALFGGAAVKGKMPVTVNKTFQFGQGVELMGGLRFKYTVPEEAGMDSRYLAKRIDSIVVMGLREQAYPGAQVLVVKDRKVVYHKTYGYHTYDSLRSVKVDDIYDFASITKVTGPLPALMKLYEEGKIDLDAKFSTYWPDFKESNKSEATVREVLAHYAQFQAWIAYWQTEKKKNGKYKSRSFKPRQSNNYPIKITDNLYLHRKYKNKIYKAIKKSPLLDEKKYVYSGLSFYLYPEIIENLTGVPFEDYVKNTFYRRLGAQTLTYNPSRFYPLEQIVPTEIDTFFRMEPIHGWVHDEGAIMMSGISGNAGLFGTANDLAKLMQMYMDKGSYGGERYLSNSTLTEFTRCQYCEEGNRRGLGFDKAVLEDKENGSTAIDASQASFGHSGYTGTFTWADPENGLLFVFFSNRVYPTRNNRKLYQLNIRPAIHQVLYDAIAKGLAGNNP